MYDKGERNTEKEREREGGGGGAEGRRRVAGTKESFVCLFGWLVGFLTSSSTTRLYCRQAPKQGV